MTNQLTGLIMMLAAVTLESFAQVSLKIGAGGGPRALGLPFRLHASRSRVGSSPAAWVVLGVLFYGFEILFYTRALSCLDVSVAFPLGSLCFVGVAVLSKVFLGETVSGIRWLGVGCILAGTACLAL
jgi:multidrug transporter EmrE-like cation transporter